MIEGGEIMEEKKNAEQKVDETKAENWKMTIEEFEDAGCAVNVN